MRYPRHRFLARLRLFLHSEFTEDKIILPAPLAPSRPSTHVATNDPLAEFYDQARAEAHAEVSFQCLTSDFASVELVLQRGQSPSRQDEGIDEIEIRSQGIESGAAASNGEKSVCSYRIYCGPMFEPFIQRFQCDNPSPIMRGTCPNQDVVDRVRKRGR